MKTINKILRFLLKLTGVGLLIQKRIRNRRQLKKVADNGYETAPDVLFPHSDIKSKKLHYGPIHPGLK